MSFIFSRITDRELQLANYMLQGITTTRIAQVTGLASNTLQDNLLRLKQKLNCTNRISPDSSPNFEFSARELEILSWLHNGKGLEQIALILGISTITVKKNIAAIKTKTNCYTQFQLGEIFARLLIQD